jgi:hypothetical protein
MDINIKGLLSKKTIRIFQKFDPLTIFLVFKFQCGARTWVEFDMPDLDSKMECHNW